MHSWRSPAIVLVMSLSALGCKNKKPDPGPEQLVTVTAPIDVMLEQTFPLAIPQGSAALLRVNLASAQQGYLDMAKLMGAQDTPEAKVESPASLLTLVLLAQAGRGQGFMSRYQEPGLLPGLDTSGTVFGVMAVHDPQDVIQAYRTSAPVLEQEVKLAGVSWSFSLPATDAAQLASALKDARRQQLFLAPSVARVQRVEVEGERVELTLLALNSPADTLAKPNKSRQQSQPFQDTVALRAFLGNDAAFGVYARAEELVDLALIYSAREVMLALENATPETRQQLWRHANQLIAESAMLDDAQSYEFVDVALLARQQAGTGFRVEALRSETPLGKKIAAASLATAKLPDVSTPTALLTLALRYDFNAARSQARMSRQLEHLLQQDGGDSLYTQALMNAGYLSYISLISMPTALIGRALRTLPDKPLLMGANVVLSLVAERLHMGAAIALPAGTIPEDALPQVWMSMSGGLVVGEPSQERHGSHDLFKVSAPTMSFSSPMPPAQGAPALSLSLSLQQLAMFMEGKHPMAGLLKTLAAKIPALKLTAHRKPGYAHTTLSTSGESLAPLALLTPPPQTAQPVGQPDCLLEGVRISQRALDFWGRGAPDVFGEGEEVPFLDDALSSLELVAPRCEASAAQLEQLRARWLFVRARILMRRLKTRGLQDMVASCELGFARACGAGGEWEELMSATFGRVPARMESAGEPRYLWRLERGELVQLSLPGDDGASDTLALTPQAMAELTERSRLVQIALGEHMVIAAERQLRWLAPLLHALTVPMPRRAREKELLRQDNPAPALTIPVHSGERVIGLTLHPTPRSGDRVITMTLGAGGLTVSVSGKALAPIKGCPKRGATLCATGLSSLPEDATPEQGRAAVASDLAALEPERLGALLGALRSERPTRVVFAGAPHVPFGVAAALLGHAHQALGASQTQLAIEVLPPP